MEFVINKKFNCDGIISRKASEVMRMFGLTKDRLGQMAITHSCCVTVNPGDIVYITGPSGAGKSVIFNEFEAVIEEDRRINISQVPLADDKRVIDCIDEDGLLEGLRFLNTAGLNDVFCVLNKPAYLREGQKWRFRLAMAMAAGKEFVFADEFCSNLDRITAAVIAYNVRRFANKNGVTFVLASSHDDIAGDLEADVLIVKELAGPAKVVYREKGRANASVQCCKQAED